MDGYRMVLSHGCTSIMCLYKVSQKYQCLILQSQFHVCEVFKKSLLGYECDEAAVSNWLYNRLFQL